MRAAILYSLIYGCALFTFGFSIGQIQDYGFELRRCDENFFTQCDAERNSDRLAQGSVINTLCLPFRSPLDIPSK